MVIMKQTLQSPVRLCIALIALLALSSCSNEQNQPQPSSVIGNPEILAQLETVDKLSLKNENEIVPLKASDLDALNKSVSSDPLASHYIEELYYMLAHNGSEHIAHNIDFLQTYIKTGKEYACTPHELWHATLYIKNDDLGLVEHAVEDASESLPLWEAESREKQKKFPQFYLRLDEQIVEAGYLIEQLHQKNYSSAIVERLAALGQTASC